MEAAEVKSWVLMRVERSGLVVGWKVRVGVGGSVHSGVMLVGSRVPRTLEEGRDVLMREGLWISEYVVVASRPAWRWITEGLSVRSEEGDLGWKTYCLLRQGAQGRIL